MSEINKPALVGILSLIAMFVVLFVLYYFLPQSMGNWKPVVGIGSAIITWLIGMVICYKITKV